MRPSQGKAAADRPGKAKGSAEKHGEARSAAHDADTPRATKTRAPQEGEKVIIRRLPPGMTEAECLSILGSEWAVGNGKVDWFSYAVGKVSNEYVCEPPDAYPLLSFVVLRLGRTNMGDVKGFQSHRGLLEHTFT